MTNKNVYSPFKFVHMLDELKKVKQGKIVSPVNLQIDPTNYCNNNCRWCYYTTHKHLKEFSKTDQIDTDLAISIIRQFADLGGKSVEFTGGGEPLLHKGFKEMSQAARESGLERALVTNGRLLSPKIVDEVKDYSWVRVSVNASTPEMYQKIHQVDGKHFETVVDNLAHLCSQKESTNIVGVSVITDEYNWVQNKDIAQMAKELGADNTRISIAHTEQGASMFNGIWKDVCDIIEDAKELDDDNYSVFSFSNRINDIARETRGGFCYYHHFTTAVGANAVDYPCCYFKYVPQFNMGNLKEQSFKEIWTGKKRRKFIDTVAKDCYASCWMTDKNKLCGYITLSRGEVPHLNFP